MNKISAIEISTGFVEPQKMSMGGEESEARSGPGPNCVPGQEPLAGGAADHSVTTVRS
jgi:hypothetical protein